MRKTKHFTSEFLNNIFRYNQCVSIFVYRKKIFYLIDEKHNFELNAKISFDSYLDIGMIKKEQYDNEYKGYRNGIWQLTKDNFEHYLESDSVMIFEKDELKELLFYGFSDEEIVRLYSVVENKLSYNDPISHSVPGSDFLKINQISSRLPLFYINFDTEVYLHMDWDRCHEDYVYDGWFAKAMDFGYLIPDEFCYWKIGGRDYWKFRQL